VRQVVEGYLSGLHRSPYHGVSVEFAEHRAYAPGDELRHLDWRLWARSDRFYVKLYEEESNVRAYFLMDASHSMAYGSGPMSKYDYGAVLAASLAWLLLAQQDAVGLTLFDTQVRAELPPAANPAQLGAFCHMLEEQRPANETNLGSLLHALAEKLAKRGLIVLVSDLMGPQADVLSALHRFRYDGHAVIVLHVVDPDELAFPFDGNVRFEGLETGGKLLTDCRQVRAAYVDCFARFRHAVRSACLQQRADYVLASSGQPPLSCLLQLLSPEARLHR
jgi:uncharacterized protein (DUF58 family)